VEEDGAAIWVDILGRDVAMEEDVAFVQLGVLAGIQKWQ